MICSLIKGPRVILFDTRLCVQNESDSLPTSSSSLPHLHDHQKTVTELIKLLQVTEEQARAIYEQKIIEQRNSPY